MSDIQCLANLFTENYRLVLDQQWRTLDNNLKSYVSRDNDTVVIVGLLRVNFMYRSKLPSYNICLDLASEILKERGEDPKIVLRGLYK